MRRNLTPPPFDGKAGGYAYLKHLHPKETAKLALKATPEVAALFATVRAAKVEIKRVDGIKSQAEQEICAVMGPAEKLGGEGFTATWKTQAGRVAWKAAADEAIDLGDRARTQLAAGRAQDALLTLEGLDGLRERSAGAPARAFRTYFTGDEGDDSP